MSHTTVNPFDGRLIAHPEEIDSANGTPIPELYADPDPGLAEHAWVLHRQQIGGSPIGLLLALTYADAVAGQYYFSYRTIIGGVVRVQLQDIPI